MSRLDGELELKAAAGRRIEVVAGGGGRRRWSEDEKARAIEASPAPGVVELRAMFGWTSDQMPALYTKAADRARMAGTGMTKLERGGRK